MNWKYTDLMDWDDTVGPIPNVVWLDISHNGLTELPIKIFKLVSLQIFYCYSNKLTELPKEIGQLVLLQTFSCDFNKLTELPKEIGQLVLLHRFHCNSNQLTELPKEIGQLVLLQTFYCDHNQLTELPFEITLLNNLRSFNHSGNEIEYIPPNISRFINRMRNTNHNNGVYNDSQSVHNHSIQDSIRKSIQYILSVKPSIDYDMLIKSILNNALLTTQTKEILMEYMDCSDVHSVLNVTFKELLLNVFSIGMSNKNSNEIFTIMNQEMQDAECKCFTGRMSRLVNCLNGFDDNIQITISDNEQIGNVIVQLKKKTNDVEELKVMVKKELSMMDYGEKVISEWIEYIE